MGRCSCIRLKRGRKFCRWFFGVVFDGMFFGGVVLAGWFWRDDFLRDALNEARTLVLLVL